MNIINLTPHAINFCNEDGTCIRTVESSGTLARVSVSVAQIGEIDGIPITQSEYSDVVGLPAPEPDTIYIVSALVAQRCADREDVFIPNEAVRDDQGRIIGCKSLGRV